MTEIPHRGGLQLALVELVTLECGDRIWIAYACG